MYLNFFRLKEKPFSLTPDSQFIYPSKKHTGGLDYLRYGILEKKGFILITGEAGCGKTTLCRAVLSSIDEKVEVALILNSFLSEIELLRAINRDFGIDSSGETREQLVSVLNKFLLYQKEQNKIVVVMVDESQNLNPAVLEQLRMLSNLETTKEKLLQIVLVGQPELDQILASHELRQLNQRITVRYHIEPLTFEETQEYISHRLSVASEEEIKINFTLPALRKIFKASKGIPRNINVLCDYAMLTAYVHESFTIDITIVTKTMKELRWQSRLSLPLIKVKDINWRSRLKLLRLDIKNLRWPSQLTFPQINWKWPGAIAATCLAIFAVGNFPFSSKTSVETKPVQVVLEDLTFVSKPKKVEILTYADKESALWASAQLWSKRKPFPKTTSGQNKKILLTQIGFRTAETWAGLDILAKINFPCVLEVKFPDQENNSFVVLSKLRGQKAYFLATQNQKKALSWDELEKRWRGKATIVYRDPKGGSLSKIYIQNMQGNGVELLQKRLSAIGYLDGGVTGVFDLETGKAVEKLQQDLGFPVDGVAGTETHLALFHLNHQEETPHLTTSPSTTYLSYEGE